MNKYKKWSAIFVFTVLTLFISNGFFLYYTDIYSAAHPKRTIFPTAFSQRLFIINYFEQKKPRYEAFIFGSSRVQYVNPLHIKKFTHLKTYNLTIAEGIPEEYLLMLKYLLNIGHKPKLILIGLDNFSHNISFQAHQNALETKSHYLLTQENRWRFYSAYFLRKPTKKDFQDIKNTSKGLNLYKMHYDIIYHQNSIYSKGIPYKQPKPTNPIYNDPTTWHGNNIPNALKAIKEIKSICEQRHIKCIFFINPVQHTSYKAMNKQLFEIFKTKLAYITDYYDFTQPNKISNNNKYWLETSHFIPKIGDLILKTIFTDKVYVKNFGIHIPQKKEKD